MLELESILVVIEPGEESQPALEKAVQVARYTGSSLSLLIAEYNRYLEDGFYFEPVQADRLRREYLAQRFAELEALAKPLREEGSDVSISAVFGNPVHEKVIERAGEIGASMVVSATKHHSKTARLFLSNEDWELIRYCPLPLLLTHARPWSDNPKIIAAVDPDHLKEKPATLDNKIVATARSLAVISGGEVHLFHAMPVPDLSGLYPLTVRFEDRKKRLDALAAEHGIDPIYCHVTDESVDSGLTTLLEDIGASVVIMGAVSRSHLKRLLIGNTAETVLDQLDCDVLVVKPDDFPAHGGTR